MIKMDKKGFTVIEILLSFVLVMIIIINLFSIIINYRDRSYIEMLKTDYLTFKSVVTKDIQTDILKKGLSSIETVTPASKCGADITQCINLKFMDGTNKNLFLYDKDTADAIRNKYLQYGDQKYKIRNDLPKPGEVPDEQLHGFQKLELYTGRFFEDRIVGDDHVYGIHIGLYHTDLEGDYGIHIIAVPGLGNLPEDDTPTPTPTPSPTSSPNPTPTPTPSYSSLASQAKIGDYVAYDAGTWSQTVGVNSASKNFQFGGYTAGKSKNDSVTCWDGKANNSNGWRVIEIKDDTVKIIHAGTPECMVFPYVDNNQNLAYSCQKMLSGYTSRPDLINSNFTSTPRDWSYYVNSNYATSATSVTKEILERVVGKINSQSIYSNDLIAIGSYYWISTAPMYTNDFWSVAFNGKASGNTGIYGKSPIFGIRPVVTLKKGLKTSGKNASGSWQLVN